VPAPTNLVVPPYRYIDENTLVIGEDMEVAA
jgi:ubiquinol-cytochrome c reductase iron-sulfur subunit